MKFSHHGLQVELKDEWWTQAGMAGFVPNSTAYRVRHDVRKGFVVGSSEIQEVLIEDVGPVSRAPGVGIFNDSEDGISARDRVIRILQGFRLNEAIPPVEVAKGRPGYSYPYRLVHGAHRLYCSLGAGFTHVPIIEGFDLEMLDR